MKFLRVISSMDPSMGGPCQGIRNSIPELKKIGVENEVFCLDEPRAPYLEKDIFTTHAMGPAKYTWAYTSQAIPWLLENLLRFDVVIIHGLWQFHIYAVYRAIQILKKADNKNEIIPKFYIMPHGMLDPYSLKSKGNFSALRKLLYWHLIESKIINTADGVLFTCKEELLLAGKTYSSYKPQKEINLGYGIQDPPPMRYSMHEAFIKKCPNLLNKPYLLFLGRIHEKKGIDILVKAYQMLALKSILPKLVLAGPGLNTSYGQKIKEMIKSDPRTSSDIFIPGMLVEDEKWGAFYGCDAFILPSHQENFGIAVVEALACSKPVLITDQVNIWREIKNSGGGLVEKDTPAGVLALLNSWIHLNEKEKNKMRKKARISYLSNFSITVYATQLKDYFSEVDSELLLENKEITLP